MSTSPASARPKKSTGESIAASMKSPLNVPAVRGYNTSASDEAALSASMTPS